MPPRPRRRLGLGSRRGRRRLRVVVAVMLVVMAGGGDCALLAGGEVEGAQGRCGASRVARDGLVQCGGRGTPMCAGRSAPVYRLLARTLHW